MGIGAAVRRAAGPLEPVLSDTYRAFFFDIDGFANKLGELGADSPIREVVEIGAGEGALVSRLVLRLPKAHLVGIDTTARVGRQCSGHWSRVEFLQVTAPVLASQRPNAADLVVLCDVLHHVQPRDLREVLASAATLLKPGGRLVVKEWLRQPSPVYWLGWASDRFITGDRIIYRARESWLHVISDAAPQLELVHEWRLAPWSCNHAFVLRSPP
jgi:2-polyprenyl-6-hydroxyphenyl methylase/3-demethylubiquinone-9 3-methyltransferase